jgi:predicted nucleic acid-binding protein
MNQVFADTLYWVAVLRPNDPHSQPARRARAQLGEVGLVTTEEVLIECLGFVSGAGAAVRRMAAVAVQEILQSGDALVVPQSHESFLAGLHLFQRRPDKGYSLVDCISMNVMRSRSIREVLTDDRHFAQEGFTPLL